MQERQADGFIKGCLPCGLTCQRHRPCGHACPLECHTSDCPPCEVEVLESCHCGRSNVSTTCCMLEQVYIYTLASAAIYCQLTSAFRLYDAVYAESCQETCC